MRKDVETEFAGVVAVSTAADTTEGEALNCDHENLDVSASAAWVHVGRTADLKNHLVRNGGPALSVVENLALELRVLAQNVQRQRVLTVRPISSTSKG